MFINRKFTLLWIAQIFSQIATNIVLFYITVVVYSKTLSNSSVSLAILIFIIPSFFSSVIAGVIVARMGKKWVLSFANIIRAFLLVPLIWINPESSFLYVILFLLAFTTQFFSPAESSLIPLIVPSDKLVSANAYFSSTINITLMIGFLVTPILLKLIGDATILLTISFFIISAFLLLFIPIKEPLFFTNLKQPIPNLIRKFLSYFNYISSINKKDLQIKNNIYTISIFQVMIFVLIALAPGFAHKILQVGVEDVSYLVIFPTAFGYFIASIYLQNKTRIINILSLKKITYMLTMINCLFIFMISQIPVSLFTRFLLFILLSFFGFLNGRIVIYSYAIIQKQTSMGDRAKYFGYLNAYTNLSSIIPVILSGYLSDILGIDKVILILAIFFGYMWKKQSK